MRLIPIRRVAPGGLALLQRVFRTAVSAAAATIAAGTMLLAGMADAPRRSRRNAIVGGRNWPACRAVAAMRVPQRRPAVLARNCRAPSTATAPWAARTSNSCSSARLAPAAMRWRARPHRAIAGAVRLAAGASPGWRRWRAARAAAGRHRWQLPAGHVSDAGAAASARLLRGAVWRAGAAAIRAAASSRAIRLFDGELGRKEGRALWRWARPSA